MHRFYVPQKNVSGDRVEITDATARHQIENVLRKRLGDQLEIFSDDGLERIVEIRLINKGSLVARIVEEKGPNAASRGTEITLYLGLLKKDKFEWVLQKGTEIGVSRFVPILSEHAVKQIKEIPPRWEKILQEAAEQCGATKIPQILEPIKFSRAVASEEDFASRNGIQLFFHPSAPEKFSEDFLKEKPEKIGVWIGPEGGFSQREVEAAREHGFRVVSMGERVLRAETAAIAYPAILQYVLSRNS